MNIERIFADADLSRGLAAAALPTDTSEFDAINEKLNTLTIAKAAKLDALMPQAVANPFAAKYDPNTVGVNTSSAVNQYGNLENTTTVLPDGQKESNANKIWNDLSHEELQAKIGDTLGNYALQTDPKTGGQYYYQPDENGNQTRVDYDGKARRFYSYNTKEAGSDVVKFGLSTDKHASSDARYSPLTGWLSGPKGVDTKKNLVDVLLPYDKATELEGLIHGNSGALAQRVVKSDDLAGRKAYGSGASEYYSSIDNVLGDVSQSDLSSVVAKDFIGANSARLEPAVTGDNFMSLKRAGNIAKAPVAMASKWLLDTAAAVTGLVSDKAADAVFGTSDERAKGIHKLVGYDSRYSQEHLNVISKMVAANMGQEIAESDKGWFDRAVEDYKGWGSTQIQAMNRLVSNLDGEEFGRIITESLKSPETAVEFYGVIALETLGAKGAGLATKAGKAEKMIASINADSKLSTADKLAKIAKVEEVSGITNVNKLALTAAQQSPIALLAFGQTKVQEEDFIKNAGRKYTLEEALGVTMMNILSFKLEKAVDMEQLKGVQGVASAAERVLSKLPDNVAGNVASSLLKNSARLVAGATEESAQELVQGYMEELNKYNLYGDDAKSMTKIQEMDMANNAATGMLAAIGSTGIMQSPSIVKDLVSNTKLGSKIADKLTSSKETKTNAPVVDESRSEASPEDKTHMVNVLEALDDDKFDYTANTKGTLEDINRAEDTLSRITKTNDNAEIIADAKSRLSSAKTRALRLVDNSDAEDFKLGSREDAEALLEFTLENSSKEEVVSRDAKMMKIAEQFGLEKEYKHLKDYYSVEKEAVEGDRGYKGYEKQLKVILASDKPDTKEVTKIVKRLQNYYQQENSYVQALTAGIKEAEAIASAHNRNATLGKPAQYEVTIPGQKVNKPWKINFEEVNGKYVVPAVTHNMLETKKRNVDGIVRALAEGGSKAKAKKLEVNTGTSLGITIPMATTGKAKNVEELNKYREMDANRYDKLGVTKVILGLKHDKKWDIYRKLNESKINQGVYTRDDVVVLNVTALEVKGSKASLDASTAREVKAAMKAGATIVIDSGIYGKDAKGKGAGKLHTQLTLLLSRYTSPDNKYGIVAKADGNTKGSHVFKPKEIADKENEIAKMTASTVKQKAKEKQTAIDTLVLALAAERTNSEYTKNEEIVTVKSAMKTASEHFKASTVGENAGSSAADNARRHAERILDEEVAAGALVIFEIVSKQTNEPKGYIEAEIGDGIRLDNSIGGHKKITNSSILKLVTERVENMLDQSKNTKQLFNEWSEHIEDLKAGVTSISMEKWLEAKLVELKLDVDVKGQVDLTNSISAGLDKILSYQIVNKGKNVQVIKKSDAKVTNNIGYIQTLELDINNIVKIGKATVMNTIPLALIHSLAPRLVTTTEKALKSITNAIDINKFNDTLKTSSGNTKQIFALKDAPGMAILLNGDGSINETVATVLSLAVDEALKNSAYMLSGLPKSKQDIADMLGLEITDVTPQVAKIMSTKGMLGKTLATELRKSIADKLGLVRADNSEVEARRFDQAMTDLAQVAIAIGIDQKIFERDTSLTVREYAKNILQIAEDEIVVGKDAKMTFIKLLDDAIDSRQELVSRYDKNVDSLPLEDSYRKDPIYGDKRPSDKRIEEILAKGVKNDISGSTIPEEAQQLLKEGMKTQHYADVIRIKDLLGNEARTNAIMKKLGYKALDSKENLEQSKDAQDIQEAINRDVEKEIYELNRLVTLAAGGDTLSMYFLMYYTKNGRYMYDVNTVNPQTNKQLTRWLIQPASHYVEVTYSNEDGHKFFVADEDITDQYMFALGQAFGYGVDKKNFENTKKTVEAILDALMKKEYDLDTLFDRMLEGKVNLGDVEVEIEHIAHAHQAIEMLKSLRETGKTVSALTAEIDAKTSGFAIKTGLMPIINDVYEALDTVGTSIGADESGIRAKLNVAMLGDPLEGSGLDKRSDTYESLGENMKTRTYAEAEKADKDIDTSKIYEKAKGGISSYQTNLFDKVHTILGEVEAGKISKTIRNLFKQPFMEFNYSAGLTSIRKSLAYTLAHKVAEDAMKSEDAFKNLGMDKITGLKFKDYVNLLQTKNLDKITKHEISSGVAMNERTSLEYVLMLAMDRIYGSQVQEIFVKKYAPAIQAQGVINQAYQAMFQAYSVVYNRKLGELRTTKNMVTIGDYKALVKELRGQFPLIKGPLSDTDSHDDSIAIYSTKTASPSDVEAGAPGSQVPIKANWGKEHGFANEVTDNGYSSGTIQYEIKKFEQAMSAGSVIPIHYFDGALLAKAILAMNKEGIHGFTMIHDAIMPIISALFITGKAYNEGMYDMTFGEAQYKIIDELLASLERVQNSVLTDTETMSHEIKAAQQVYTRGVAKDVTQRAKPEKTTVEKQLEFTIVELKKLKAHVDEKHAELQASIKKGGIIISNLVTGHDTGTYVVNGQEKAESSLKQAKTKENSGKITAEYISKELPQLSAEQAEELVQLLKELPVEAAKASIDKLRHCI